MNNTLPYRKNVCLLIMNCEQKLFLGERAGSPGIWQLPQGGVSDHGTEAQAALEEAVEELGADRESFTIIKKLMATHRYDFREPPAYAVGKWRGQEQSFWLLSFNGSDNAIDLGKYQQEFSSYCWCSVSEVRLRAEALRLPGYLAPLLEVEAYLKSEPLEGGE